MSGKPMDPERLAELRTLIGRTYSGRELLADRDHWEAEAERLESLRAKLGALVLAQAAEIARYRARCPVTAEDCDAAGATKAKLIAWMSTRDQQLVVHYRLNPVSIADEVNEWAERHDRPAFDIIDEIVQQAADRAVGL